MCKFCGRIGAYSYKKWALKMYMYDYYYIEKQEAITFDVWNRQNFGGKDKAMHVVIFTNIIKNIVLQGNNTYKNS